VRWCFVYWITISSGALTMVRILTSGLLPRSGWTSDTLKFMKMLNFWTVQVWCKEFISKTIKNQLHREIRCRTWIGANHLPVAWPILNWLKCHNNEWELYVPNTKSHAGTHARQWPTLFFICGCFTSFSDMTEVEQRSVIKFLHTKKFNCSEIIAEFASVYGKQVYAKKTLAC
jgi:hypothetical protein